MSMQKYMSAFTLAVAAGLSGGADAGTQTVYVDKEVPSQNLGPANATTKYKLFYTVFFSGEPFIRPNFRGMEDGTFYASESKPITGIKMCQQLAVQFSQNAEYDFDKAIEDRASKRSVSVSSWCVPIPNSYQVADWGYTVTSGDKGGRVMSQRDLIRPGFAKSKPSERASKVFEDIRLLQID